MAQIKKQKSLTTEDERKIVTHLLTTYYNFKEHTPLRICTDPFQYWFLDEDDNEWVFDGGCVDLKTLFEELREELEYREYELDNFEQNWLLTIVKLGIYTK